MGDSGKPVVVFPRDVVTILIYIRTTHLGTHAMVGSGGAES